MPERVLLDRHPHGGVLAGPVLVFLLVAGLTGYLAAVTRAWLPVGLAAAALLGVFTVLPLVRWARTHLVLTTERLVVRERGRQLDVPLSRIVAVRARPTWLGHGALVVVTDTDGEVELAGVPDVAAVREAVERARAR